ncbi:MAG: hypothetical protein CM15mP85_31270 [Rhodobacterales bacterium]|nr:MAG: hypothetical protein CM15mP85_31270 [Rhodobacterales bacterium]
MKQLLMQLRKIIFCRQRKGMQENEQLLSENQQLLAENDQLLSDVTEAKKKIIRLQLVEENTQKECGKKS